MQTQPASTQRDGATGQSPFDTMDFVFRLMSSKLRTLTIVQVTAVTNAGDVSAVGFVDVQPLVQQVDGTGNVMALPPLYGLPYLRIQGGTDAMILDPKVGDLGLALFADRDLSAVISAKGSAPPGSGRQHSLSDGFYIGGILNGVPQQYFRFSSSGIEVVSPTQITLTAPNVVVNASTQLKMTSADIQEVGPVHITGAQTNDGTITAQGDVIGAGTSVHNHKHGGVSTGSGQTSAPV